MMVDWFYTAHAIKEWWHNEEGVAMMEAVMLFPPMMVLLMGTFDMGNAIILNQKTITSSQIAADLVARDRTVNLSKVEDTMSGARLAFEPFALQDFGIDIVSVEFDADRRPQILWRETRDMPPNNEAVDNVIGVGTEGEGMIIVTVQYTYTPFFARLFINPVDMQEVAYSRGRRSPTVTWEG